MGSSHSGVRCNFCNELPIIGTRYACLVCEDYNLCRSCFLCKKHNSNHTSHHPVQSTRRTSPVQCHPVQRYYNYPDARAEETYCCSNCGEKDLTGIRLIQHCRRLHAEDSYPVHCPVCIHAGNPCNIWVMKIPLLDHLLEEHVQFNASWFDVRMEPTLGERPIQRLQRTVEEKTECTICMENLPTGGAGIRHLRCAHGFHSSCITRWLEENSSCPVCRTKVNS